MRLILILIIAGLFVASSASAVVPETSDDVVNALHGIPQAAHASAPSAHCDPDNLNVATPTTCKEHRVLHVVIKWKGRKHPYLQNPAVHIKAPDELKAVFAPVDATDPSSKDTQTVLSSLELDPKTKSVTLDWSVAFSPKVRLVSMKSARTVNDLSAAEKDTINWPPCAKPSLAVQAAPNALVTETFDAASATLTATLDTGYVDLTDLLHEAGEGLDGESENPVKVWEASDPTHEKMRLISSTDGKLLWSVYLPAADADPKKADAPVSRIVIYPHEIDHWDPVIGPANPRHTLFYANKYLITDCIHPAKHPLNGAGCIWLHHSWGGWTNWIAPGFGPALEATGKRGLILIPWTSAAKGTAGEGFDLPDRSLSIAHLLQSEGRVSGTMPFIGTRDPSVGTQLTATSPLILASFSGGAEGWIVSFKKFKDRIDGLWGFDPITHAPDVSGGVGKKELVEIADWLKGHPDTSLRISDSMYENRWAPYFRDLKLDGVESPRLTHQYIQASPDAMRWYGTQNVSTIDPSWVMHQFSVNGGLQDKKGHRTSYFELFSEQLP